MEEAGQVNGTAGVPATTRQLELLPEYSQARAMIERVARVDEAKAIHDKASALRAYAHRAKDNELAALATEIMLRSQRKAGDLLIDAKLQGRREKRGGDRKSKFRKGTLENGVPDGNSKLPTLEDLGITKKESMLWQRIARLPEEIFEARIARLRSPFAPLFSSASDEWLTPRAILDRVVACLGAITLDPCAAAEEPGNVPAETCLCKSDDGLAHEWSGNVFLNPPYGDVVDHWCEKLVTGWREGRIETAIALLAARTDTRWFRMFRFAPVCFISGRLKFRRAGKPEAEEHGAPFPAALFYLGADKKRFHAVFAQLGEIRDAAIAG